jgi:hypothetical protein
VKAIIVFAKTLREMSREAWMLGLTLAFAPLFVFLYWVWFSGGSTTYGLVVINNDAGITLTDGRSINEGAEAVAAMIGNVTYADGKPLLKVIPAVDRLEARPLIENRHAAAYISIPADFSQTLASVRGEGPPLKSVVSFGGDAANPYYMVAVNLVSVNFPPS